MCHAVWWDGSCAICHSFNCIPWVKLQELERALRVDEAAPLLAALTYPGFKLNEEREAIQVLSQCSPGKIAAHLPIDPPLLRKLMLAVGS